MQIKACRGPVVYKQEMSLKKTNGVGLKKRRKYNTRLSILVYKSYTDYGNLKMNIVK